MNFTQQQTDPGGVKSLLALLRGNQASQDETKATTSNEPATKKRQTVNHPPVPWSTQPPSDGSTQSSTWPEWQGIERSAEPATPATTPSLQELLAKLRQSNTTTSSRPFESVLKRPRSTTPDHYPSSRGERESNDYATDISHKRSRQEFQQRPDQGPSRPASSLKSKAPVSSANRPNINTPGTPSDGWFSNLPPGAAVPTSSAPLNKPVTVVKKVVKPEEFQQTKSSKSEFGYTMSETRTLLLDKGRPIVDVLLQRRSIVSEIEKLKEDQDRFERQMSKKKNEIIEEYAKKLPKNRDREPEQYEKSITQRSAALLKFYKTRVLPFYDHTYQKQVEKLDQLGFPCLGDPNVSNAELESDELRDSRRAVLKAVNDSLGE